METTETKHPPPAFVDTVEEITQIYKSLPPRNSIEEVEADISVLRTVETEQNLQLEEISKEVAPQGVPPELFSVLKEVKKAHVSFRSLEQRKEAAHLVELDQFFQLFDELIQRASALVSGDAQMGKESDFSGSRYEMMGKVVIEKAKSFVRVDEEDAKRVDVDVLKEVVPRSSSGEAVPEKFDLLKVAAIIENFAKTGASILDLEGKLMDKIEWLPVSIGKLSTLTELYLSGNRIMALPNSIGSLKALMKLHVRANQLINLPNSVGELQNLIDLDLAANMLKSLPESFGNLKNLINLDLSSNHFSSLPAIIGNLSSLQRLNVETNDLEELPHSIGLCSSLLELRLDFNQLKALPEAVGELEQLEILTLHYNRVKRLPTTMGKLSHLRELDVSFNELERIPETLCSAASLQKLNVGKNFADLSMLPESIGNLENLEELDISDNQIRTLPDSFRFLSKLRILRTDQTPLQVPPIQITKLGAEAVVQYVADFVAGKELKPQPIKKKGFWSYICPLFCFGIGK